MTELELPDYLWGIETFLIVLVVSRRWWSFQTTYEELKHYLHSTKRCYSMRFQTTYEELKLSRAICISISSGGLPDYLWGIETPQIVNQSNISFGFQTTYEELKPVVKESASTQTPASRLPMRNWNFATVKHWKHRLALLPDYLWGIETPLVKDCEVHTQLASRLPMRNWNFLWQPALSFPLALPDYLWGIETRSIGALRGRSFASRLPMRNWNDSDHAETLETTAMWLPDYLWGIETLSQLRSLRFAWSFQTTYEELKRGIPYSEVEKFCRFQTTYEELKLK